MYSSAVVESMPERIRVPSLPFPEARACFTEVVGWAEDARSYTIITGRGQDAAVAMPIDALVPNPAAASVALRRSSDEQQFAGRI
jgi:hypothetical protein